MQNSAKSPPPVRPSVWEVLEGNWKATHPVPKFTLNSTYYDQRTYWGRVRHICSMIDPRLMLVSESEIVIAKETIERYKHAASIGERVPETDREMWQAKRIVDSAIHPSTGELIPRFGRLAFFIPSNVPIALGMLTSKGVGSTVFWQFVNQSLNALFNVANSPGGWKSKDSSVQFFDRVTNDPIVPAYILAVGSSCGISLFLRSSRFTRNIPSWLVAYLSVAGAGSINNFFMRRSELVQGVQVSNGYENLGISKRAAAIGLAATILSRSVFLPLPLLGLPGVFMKFLRLGWYSQRTPSIRVPAEVFCITAATAISFPLCAAVLPQNLVIPGNWLEDNFHKTSYVNINRGF